MVAARRDPGSDMQRITLLVAAHYGVPLGYLVGSHPGRRIPPKLVESRRVAMYLAREATGCSYPAIGRFFSVKHSTVVKVCQLLARDFPPHAEKVLDRALFPSGRVGHA